LINEFKSLKLNKKIKPEKLEKKLTEKLYQIE